jgi:lysophospholipase L1-like esterase
VDTLPALKQSVGNQLYAQTTRDMHPGKNGYRVIGEAVSEYLKRSGSGG